MMRRLLANGEEVLGISRSIGYLNETVVEKYKCDVLEKDKLKKILIDFSPDRIVHMASPAFIPDSYNSPSQTYNLIFQGTLNLLEAIRELGLQCRLLYISSADVYGYGGGKGILSEDLPYDPINPYSSAKACSELLCGQYNRTYGMDTIIARPFNHTGSEQSRDFVCSNFAYQIASMKSMDKEMKIYTGNIDVKRDFLDVRDVVDAYVDLLKYAESGQVYNVCSSQAISIREIIKVLFEVGQVDRYEIVVDPAKVRTNDIALRIGDNSKIASLCGWKPQYDIRETMMSLLNYWEENCLNGK